MKDKAFLDRLELPEALSAVFDACPSVRVFETVDELMECSFGRPGDDYFEIQYTLPDGRPVTEMTVARVRNGIAANYPEAYMRRRDPDCMVIADDSPTDKPRFKERFGHEFDGLRQETLDWMSGQDLGVFLFRTGQPGLGQNAVAVVPANAAVFAFGLALLQGILTADEVSAPFSPDVVIWVAPPFRHTHFSGKQVVVHNRASGRHEVFSYNLYPGPSAKKGIYGALIRQGENEGWITAHCSAVQVVTPYDNLVTIMHEGASGGGKSEMLEQPHRLPDGRLLKGRNLVTGEERYLEIPRTCELHPACDDMGLCPPQIQRGDGHLWLVDAEDGWFVRVDHIREYGADHDLEKLTAMPGTPLLFLNIDAAPKSRALIWEHVLDAPGKPCPNPRVIVPRRIVPNVVRHEVSVDIRSIGLRTPPCTRENPSYGIAGLFHVLPPALAWLWRLVAPRGHNNPSIITGSVMESEGVGSYWPFATGRRVAQANLLLRQIVETPRVRHILTPNQHVGAWYTGFMPQWLTRDYLARKGASRFTLDQIVPARCALLGHAMKSMRIEGISIANWFLQVETQPEVGTDGYDKGAEILRAFFVENLRPYLESDLDPAGRRIIACCMDNGSVEDYESILPEHREYLMDESPEMRCSL
jgi:hypothetical protein